MDSKSPSLTTNSPCVECGCLLETVRPKAAAWHSALAFLDSMERAGGSSLAVVFGLTCFLWIGAGVGVLLWIFFPIFVFGSCFLLWCLGEVSKGMSSASMQLSRHALEHAIGRCGWAFGEWHVWMYYCMASGTKGRPRRNNATSVGMSGFNIPSQLCHLFNLFMIITNYY